ncbi:hypothetical protein T09_14213 [Trichinella sp. T9]|uniref:Uncharacterized protein n=1 Tax=Trichinella murrelli TaxID=144512 RepID=A0A0V0U6F0_9BILA|nr:hypothetical protein T05_582 [Trichinella murrelli]KRX67185.1 hypothetical protein T09_14213 [Trichinella sp. T9]KRZ88093.1 hypothetical protein T08_5708 [Trichinella sp. T8]
MHDKISQQYLEYLELHASDDYSSLNFIELNLLFECRLIVQLRLEWMLKRRLDEELEAVEKIANDCSYYLF